MRKIWVCILLFIMSFTGLGGTVFGQAIDYNVSPLKYELELDPGDSITLPASIRNNGTGTVTLPTTKSDFQANGVSGTPSVVRRSELVFPDQELSSWITITQASVTLAPGEEKSIDFTIDVPSDGTPGGHYGAVLFRTPTVGSGGAGKISIDVDYGVIILVTVSGEIIVEVEIEEPTISGGGGGGGYGWSGDQGVFDSGEYSFTPTDGAWYVGNDSSGNEVYQNKDNCTFGDFTPSSFDGKCFSLSEPLLFSDDTIATGENQLQNESLLFSDDFNVNFNFPIQNKGNTHLKPSGKVVLRDSDGNILKAVGKEVISNSRGLIIDEKIVDYIPINDQGGNILPNTKRIFESQWQGFPYKAYDEDGNQVMNYWTPSEYYTAQNKQDAGFLMFWERVSEKRQHETINAEIEISYQDENGNPITFTSAKDFKIQYIEQKVTHNPYIILALLLLATAGVFLYFAIRWWFLVVKTSKCWNCRESIKSHWGTCPYCKTLQNKKQHKKYEKLSGVKKKK